MSAMQAALILPLPSVSKSSHGIISHSKSVSGLLLSRKTWAREDKAFSG